MQHNGKHISLARFFFDASSPLSIILPVSPESYRIVQPHNHFSMNNSSVMRMKKLLLFLPFMGFLVFGILAQATAQTQNGSKPAKGAGQNVAPLSNEQKLDLMLRMQKVLYSSPVSSEIVYNELMPSVKKERLAAAPHFPDRGATDADSMNEVKKWIAQFPSEFEAYIRILEQKTTLYNPTNAVK